MTKHVLVVEDDTVNALLFRMILEKRGGFQVTVTEDPAEVFAAVKSHAVDLVILDVSLSHSRWQGKPINGVEICQMIKGDPQTADIPVLLATAHAMRGDQMELMRDSGADDYVAKPIVDHAAFVAQVSSRMRRAA